jgi:hypothetical protein
VKVRAVNDGVILVSLKEGHAPTSEYVRKLRRALPAAFPKDTFYFQAADMVTWRHERAGRERNETPATVMRPTRLQSSAFGAS